jgi:hypothetical protein
MATLESLASEITAQALALSKHLAEKKLQPPSFAPDAPPSLPHGEDFAQVQAARQALVEAAQAIRDLALGPDECITAFATGVSQREYLPHAVAITQLTRTSHTT